MYRPSKVEFASLFRGFLLATILLDAGLLVVSYGHPIAVYKARYSASIDYGYIRVLRWPVRSDGAVFSMCFKFDPQGVADANYAIKNDRGSVSVSLWAPLIIGLPIWLKLAIGARAARYAAEEPRCGRCGYLLVGNQSGVCPECGVAIDPTRRASDEIAAM